MGWKPKWEECHTMCHLARSHAFPHEVSTFIYIYIYIYIDVEQIIFVQFIEFDSCNSALKLDLCKKLRSFFDSYLSHDFLDQSISIQSM